MPTDASDNGSMSSLRVRSRRTPSIASIAGFMEYLSPSELSSPETPFGIQIGDPAAPVTAAIVAPMVSANAIGIAETRSDALLITAAPLITHPLTAIRSDDPVGERIVRLIEKRVGLLVLPSSIAAAPGGLDDALAARLGLAGTSALRQTACESLFKIGVYVPPEAADSLLFAASEAGAGYIGNYSHCSFQSPGTGTFLPEDGATPTIGTVGTLERVNEVRLEMIVPQRELQGALAAILDAHPYEEVAYDVIALRNPGAPYGRGRVGDLPLPVHIDTILSQIQDALPGVSIRCSHQPSSPISRLAVTSGMSDGLTREAVRSGAGAFIVGVASPEDLLISGSGAIVLIEIGFAASVGPGLERLCDQLSRTFGDDGVEVIRCSQ